MTGKRGLWGFRYDTTHPKINHYQMHFRFLSAKWNAATRYSARPFTTKTGARVHFFCLNSPRNKGWYQARVHPFSSGNGKGDHGMTSFSGKEKNSVNLGNDVPCHLPWGRPTRPALIYPFYGSLLQMPEAGNGESTQVYEYANKGVCQFNSTYILYQ